MAVISGTSVRWPLSPRLIEIPVTETAFSARDAQDTLLDLEDNVEGMVWPKARKMTGGENLEGGISVGFTIQYQNARLVPDRTSSRSAGTVTTGSSTQLIDSAADFVTDGVQSGDWIINFTDQSVTEVLEVIDLNTLSVRDLTDGTDNDFDIGDAYKVWEVADFTLSGGNHVAIDEASSSINPMFPTFGRFCTRTSSSSATAISQTALEAALFTEGVIVDADDGVAGTGDVDGIPIGTRSKPSNNMADAKTIGDSRGVNKFKLLTDITLTTGDYSSGYTFEGDSVFIIFTNDGATVHNCTMQNLQLVGAFELNNTIENCRIYEIPPLTTTIGGKITDTGIVGEIEISQTVSCVFHSCYSLRAGENYPIFNVGSSSVITRDWRGSLGITNMTGETHTLEINSGRLIFDNTCTGGEVSARGVWSSGLENDSTGTVIDEQFIIATDVTTMTELTSSVVDLPTTHTPTSSTVNGKTWEHIGDPATSITTTRTA